jgi:hypothetical protein
MSRWDDELSPEERGKGGKLDLEAAQSELAHWGGERGAPSNGCPYRNRQIGSGRGSLAKDRGFADSPLEGSGFEL